MRNPFGNRRRWILLACAAIALAACDRTARTPAQRGGETPRLLAAKFLSAIAAGDRDAAVACIDHETDDGAEAARLVGAMAEFGATIQRLEKAIANRFGDKTLGEVKQTLALDAGGFTAMLDRLEDVPIDEGEQTAILKAAQPGGTDLRMVRRGDRWLIDPMQFLQQRPGPTVARQQIIIMIEQVESVRKRIPECESLDEFWQLWE